MLSAFRARSLGMLDELAMYLANAVLYARHPKAVRCYYRSFGRLPDIAHPRLYTERMLWRKLVDHNPRFVMFTDKLAAKAYCRRVCPELPLPRTLWSGSDADAIPEDLLRSEVFVKANHGCGFNYFVRDGEVDRADLKRKTDEWLDTTFGVGRYQWAYCRIRPRLFVEESVGDAADGLVELNVRASNGKVILGSVITCNKLPNQRVVYLDVNGNPTAGPQDPPEAPARGLPEDLDIAGPYRSAVEYTRRLSVGVDYARYDFMWNGEQLYGGEITVYPSAGMNELANPKVHATVVNGWDLDVSHFLTTRHEGLRRLYAKALRRRIRKATYSV